jgi:hypothetical protein
MSEKQTAVEWFTNEIDNLIPYVNEKTSKQFKDLADKAKELEKKQIIDAFEEGKDIEYEYHINDEPRIDAEQYYKETFNK